jgi:HK97 family phage portal protein
MSFFRQALLGGGEQRTMTLAELDSWMDTSQAGGGVTSNAGVWIDPATAMTSAVVYACVNVLAQTIGALPLIVYRRLVDGGKERSPEHRLYNLLHDAPNPEMTAYELRSCLVGHQCLWGNAYCEIERSDAGVNGLWPLRPDRMTPTRDIDNRLIYDYRLPDGTIKHFQFAQIMHWRGLSSNGIIGYSPIRQAAESIGLDLATRQAGTSFFGNDSRPGGVLTHPGKLSKDAATRLRDTWEAAHRGLNQRQRVAVLEEGVKWEQVGIPPEEAQYLETRKYGRSEIAGLYRVPLHMINDLERATFSNVEHIALEFVKFTLMPWLVQIEQAIQRDLFRISEGKRSHFAEHLVEGLLRGDSAGRAAYLQTMRQNGALNADEWRALDNLNPIEGGKGKIYWQPANMQELGEKPAPPPAPPKPDTNAPGNLPGDETTMPMNGGLDENNQSD